MNLNFFWFFCRILQNLNKRKIPETVRFQGFLEKISAWSVEPIVSKHPNASESRYIVGFRRGENRV